MIGGLVFENRSTGDLTDVRLVVIETRSHVACGYIPPGQQCVTTFPLRRYQGNSVQVLWSRAGRPEGTPPFVVPLPVPIPENTSLDVIIGIGGPGGFSAGMRPS